MRVIAGKAKGRELTAPKGLNTRPTLAKVKEAIFGMIQFDIADANVLDLFSGSGGLGIEAISRGARHTVFCDRDRSALAAVRTNLKRLGFEEQATVYSMDSIALLDQLQTSGVKFDIVLLDPPYESDLMSRALAKLDENGLLSSEALIICEHSLDNPPVFSGNYTVKEPRKYGDSYVTKAVYAGAEEK